MACVLEIRAGTPVPVDVMLTKVPQWDVKDYASGYLKEKVTGAVAVHYEGIEGNRAGFPGHVNDILDRSILVFYEPIYDHLREKFPSATKTLKRGGFGENLIVDHPSLNPKEVCIGDIYQIESVRLVVTAPRQPCPKVDVYHNVKGMTEYVKQHCMAGYFLRVLEEGEFRPGSEMVLVQRGPNPDLSLQKVSEGLWGPPAMLDNSRTFLSALVNSHDLMGHLFKNTARERLQRLDEIEGKSSSSGDSAADAEAKLVAGDEALAEYNMRCISVFVVLLFAYLYSVNFFKEDEE